MNILEICRNIKFFGIFSGSLFLVLLEFEFFTTSFFCKYLYDKLALKSLACPCSFSRIFIFWLFYFNAFLKCSYLTAISSAFFIASTQKVLFVYHFFSAFWLKPALTIFWGDDLNTNLLQNWGRCSDSWNWTQRDDYSYLESALRTKNFTRT